MSVTQCHYTSRRRPRDGFGVVRRGPGVHRGEVRCAAQRGRPHHLPDRRRSAVGDRQQERSVNPLAGALREAMVGSPHDLVVLDRETDTWQRRPWPEVHGIAESIAAYLLGRNQPGAVGLVGEPTVELIAAIQGSWLAGSGVSILPRPQRGAEPSEWAQATLARFHSIGVTTVFSYGATLQL